MTAETSSPTGTPLMTDITWIKELREGLRRDPDDAWLIVKINRGFYRPDKQGYTSKKREAGRYTEEDAKDEAAIEPSMMRAILANEVADDWVNLPPDRIAALLDRLDEVTAERDMFFTAAKRLAGGKPIAGQVRVLLKD